MGERLTGVTRSDAFFFASVAFYSGGYSASAYLTIRRADPEDWASENYRASYDLLARPHEPRSERVLELLAALRRGDSGAADSALPDAESAVLDALAQGPEEWISQQSYASLLARFSRVNLRSVLPDGMARRWDPLVDSFLDRTPPAWDFFPSQVQAIEAGLLTSDVTYSLQMPTGAGKTALTETLIFSHLTEHPDDVAILLVPYRALARELRGSLARRLTDLGLPTRTVYGGTVPTPEESQDLDAVRAFIATPEALTGLLGRSTGLLSRISLAICDEGHLLDSGARGIGLELLLARLRARAEPPRVVFVSAIVPNIEEINSWLGGSEDTVVRSDYRPAEAEYAVLRPAGRGRGITVGLEAHPLSTNLPAHTLPGFLQVSDFEFTNLRTGHRNTYPYSSFKTQALAAARKSLALGTVAVFSTTKTGQQGVIGLGEELIAQIAAGLPLPDPSDFVTHSDVTEVADYLSREYGTEWIGARTLRVGAVVHHGDIPQETREALEELLTRHHVRMVLCTSTLAEGVNLPIRTIVLYAVRRRNAAGQAEQMLARDIRNLAGRAERAGSSTKGLVICANPNDWPAVLPVATGEPGENVHGALHRLLGIVQNAVRQNGINLTNRVLEANAIVYPLVDGIDATLVELLHDELGDDEFQELASSLAVGTFAARQLDEAGQVMLSNVFALRAGQVAELRAGGRLGWIRETGARVRLVDSVVDDLVPSFSRWDEVESPLDEELLEVMVSWAYKQRDFERDVLAAYRMQDLPPATDISRLVRAWIEGRTFSEMAQNLNYEIDALLRVHSQVVSYAFTTLVEQATALLGRYLADIGIELAEAVVDLPEYLRFGVPTPAAKTMLAAGIRHRRAAVELGNDPSMSSPENALRSPSDLARELLEDEDRWRGLLGDFVYQRTRSDVAQRTGRQG
ncbi:DEAD/DEAH box helicase [Kribbella sp. NBC_00382]|uniref:DEAD/DEAH box helicase n=1 Tax=Kribbella sp. NBC_00382 TaxID=2975967 RepID=UPI002E1E5C4B